MNQTAEYIKQRLSLRKPLQDSLDILVQLCDELELSKKPDLAAALQLVQALYPTCTDFERDFPSICFSIATGVGKTRLMGACISWLYKEKHVKNFFILAPNLTIYNKLIEDFGNPAKPKYVFNGIADFVHNRPVIVTGDNYNQIGDLFNKSEVRINVFNISKFNADSKGTTQAGVKQPPRIKRLSEYLGQSYWDYLSNLDDLVILMDEAHRYHADKSRSAINELQPVLGIELTATPKLDDGTQFRNVVFEYSLAQALVDGLYVKNPTIATRKDFNPQGRSDEEIEKIKLEDAISIHEDTKQELVLYARTYNKKLIKPFILVVCRDTTHAKAVFEFVSSTEFFEGSYAGKVLQIDSTTRTELIEEQFISLEKEDNNIEIVIHVNMLKEGWDVTNLYTIVPLRAANAPILIEQTIGRGLRLPYNGERTGQEQVDKLTIVAHDNFDRVLAAAQNPESILNKLKFTEIDPSGFTRQTEVVTTQNTFVQQLQKEQAAVALIQDSELKQQQQNILDAKKLFVDIVPLFNTNSNVKSIEDLKKPEVKAEMSKAADKHLHQGQLSLYTENVLNDFDINYEAFVNSYQRNVIEIPRMVLAQEETTASFNDFDLHTGDFNFQPLNEEIVVIGLKDGSYDTIDVKPGVDYGSPIKLLISEVINYPEVDYDANADLLHKLAKQALEAIENTLVDKEALRKAVFQFRRIIAKYIYDQMMQHFVVHESIYMKPDVKPFTVIEKWNFTAFLNNGRKDYRDESMAASMVSKYLFTGFIKSGHSEYKFDSRTEQTFSFILENDDAVIKWLRPAPNQFRIYWLHNSNLYEPDFIAQTRDCIYMIEIKAANEMESPEVLQKMAAALKYCNYATAFTTENGGKPWKYALIPHNQVAKYSSFNGIVLPNLKTLP